MATFTYFAYGSNMLLARLQKRCRTARFLGVAVAHGYTLNFNKKSKKDGSGKATIVRTANDDTALYGALFEIDMSERQSLDGFEGRGYDPNDEFVVRRVNSDEKLTVTTYIARQDGMGENLKPYDWYKQLIIAGGRQRKFPDSYLTDLTEIESIPDPCPDRTDRLEALDVLKESGWPSP